MIKWNEWIKQCNAMLKGMFIIRQWKLQRSQCLKWQ